MTTSRKISGVISDGKNMKAANVEVRFTSDSIGESLSMTADGILFMVPFEAVEPIIKKERKKIGRVRG